MRHLWIEHQNAFCSQEGNSNQETDTTSIFIVGSLAAAKSEGSEEEPFLSASLSFSPPSPPKKQKKNKKVSKTEERVNHCGDESSRLMYNSEYGLYRYSDEETSM